MPATVTLASATLTYRVDVGDWEITLSDVTNVQPGYRLYIDRELMKVQRLVSGSNRVQVKRGTDGTAAAIHSSSATVWIGQPQQFYDYDPVGSPLPEVLVSPWINVRDGRVFFAQGDVQPNGRTYRWWQNMTTVYDQGSLGIRTQVGSPSSST